MRFAIKILFLIIIAGLTPSCVNDVPSGNKNKKINNHQEPTHNELQSELTKFYDTTLSSGYFLQYILDDKNNVRIVWGNKNFKRWMKDENYPDRSPSYFKFEYLDYIALGHSCGNGCWWLYVLPKNEKDSVKRYDYDITSEVYKHLILYKNSEMNAPRESFYVEHIPSGKKTEINLDSLATFGTWMNGIEQTIFVKEGLFVKWRTDKGNTIEKIFTINNLK